jgi:hypothetical protein
MVLEYLPIYMLAIFGVDVGKYSISGASGHVCFGKRTYPKFTYSSPRPPKTAGYPAALALFELRPAL